MISLSLDISQAVVPTLQHCSWLMLHGGRLAVAMRKERCSYAAFPLFAAFEHCAVWVKLCLAFVKTEPMLSSSIFSGLYLFALWRALCIHNKGAPPDIRQRDHRRLAADFKILEVFWFWWRGVGEGRHLPPTRLFGGNRCGAAQLFLLWEVKRANQSL